MERFARIERKRASSLADLKQDSLPNKLEEEGGAKGGAKKKKKKDTEQ